MHFKTDWASHIVGRKFTVFACFYFVVEGNFPSTSPREAYIWKGDLTGGFLHYRFGGLIFGGAYTWRGLFLEFYGIKPKYIVSLLQRYCHTVVCLYKTGACELAKLLYSTLVRMSSLSFQ